LNRYVLVPDSGSSEDSPTTDEKSAAARLDGGEERAVGRKHTGFRDFPHPPRPDGGSREALERRERQGVPELGLLRRAQTSKKLARK
jgi:hypothetical protein